MQGGTANPNREFWNGRRVLVVGNTGFKGSWLSIWLHLLGARVAGLSLPPPTEPSLFVLAGLADLVPTIRVDIRDLTRLRDAVAELQPDLVFHLAAQALVRPSYREPVETFATNVMGTVHVLEAVRSVPSVHSVIVVTSDKCYENREWPWAYRETEPLGGHDPYSGSKACAELVTAAYRRSFFSADRTVGVATVRAGNVIGGGDWAEDRLLPDCLRALEAGRAMAIRNPHAVRPWQHVLEPLCGYLLLAERLYADAARFGDAWNFGPADETRPVSWIAARVVERWGGGAGWFCADDAELHEACLLKVDASRARLLLRWAPRLALDQALAWTVDWHRGVAAGESASALTLAQIARYCELRP
jgi:CDP-glucose 4,6-dehydratase